ncbi:MAG TPA: multifunctional oxoglutarate decarboxylase/oxoglutarate dehydrogenase thiamine pyrophosphate-binding subunit/dihydrolipoyllysine-residue succinyltransferase subunit, partial [Actinobacteria bacterium]|nr:multifunctional oxoglutarate decarboxylase/oxoglutarate dehydrogenase thiamine pyrophosphate-binding subunit/dihydrolipoyllysine-residue succinyltransferase subunit [Actinomycetota bacterium]
REFATGGLAGRTRMTLGEILGVLRDAYCRTTGIEYMHIQEADQKAWIQEHVEGTTPELDDAERRRILERLNAAEAFERFLHTKYLGAKRFSLEGAESLVPLLDTLLDEAADFGMEHAAIGMAHRGRLNVLANVVGKELTEIFQTFEGVEPEAGEEGFSGDVKYHLGATGRHASPSGTSIEVSVANNPSHLEAVDPVLEGIVKAKQDARGDGAEDLVLPILVHGDAAFAGQGVVAETFNLSQLEGYATGGTIHVVVNNQVGFTTGPVHARSSQYATDVAKMVQAPIFHVNGDDPEAVVRATRIAFRFRQAFHKDVVIDLVCYRRLGHNEGDEPTYTQPRMYALIDARPSVRDLYLERLRRTGVITDDEAEAVARRFREMLDAAFAATRTEPPPTVTIAIEVPEPEVTAIDRQTLERIEVRLREVPEGFTVHPKLQRILDARHERFVSGVLDWGLAEAEAFGSLALEGRRVRLAGEDSSRGTFSQRHAVLVDYRTEERYVPLRHLAPDQAPVDVVDSLLSEFAALGFEYGYSVEATDALVLWEAQYGDFANGAQVIIDQFVVSGYDKWLQESGVTLLLPHGFEGQGPEHSSARLERFLQMAAEGNLRIAVPTTTAQYFHVLRRQALWEQRRPLVLLTPKSLLRHAATYSPIEEFTAGRFRKVIGDSRALRAVRRVLLCTGKIFYELDAYRDEHGIDDVAIVRVEQLYPFPTDETLDALEPYGDAEIVWVQEEPGNMGAWRFMSRALFAEVGRITRGIYRPESASPATGSSRVHAQEQRRLVERAFS